MLAKVFSGAVLGLDSILITVEVDVASRALPSFQIVGLADKAVEEARERVRSAINNSGLDFPTHRITVNLAPADLPKEGAIYDLPIAVGLLLANGSLKENSADTLYLGELSLDGELRSTPGVLPIALLAKEKKFKRVFVPAINAREAAIVNEVDVYPVSSLKQLVDHILGIETISPVPKEKLDFTVEENYEFDFADVRGQESARRALEIAAAGGHNCLMTGSPGSGKTLMARTFPSILPKLTEEEAIEVTKIYSINGLLPADNPIVKKRPFRSPHHTTSHVGLIGGGTHPKPGEISLAHRGVLFLDEIAEFPRQVLEAMRQPLEDGFVTVSRAAGTSQFPAKFILVAASNPCPCGNLNDTKKKCICTAHQIVAYKKRLSGPLLDRIDLHVFCATIPPEKLTDLEPGKSSAEIRNNVQKARERQQERYKNTGITCNAELSAKAVKIFCPLDEETTALLTQAVAALNLSGRGFHRVIKVARTIADLAGSENIEKTHVAEALGFRQKEEDNKIYG
ncbi:YifB family Mg chelatase-like AAA ATPase [Patescibacteria group bacterium]|nr:YifB family Mg chelatase-like AAA ATPase [Patescibacteria group bacterium]